MNRETTCCLCGFVGHDVKVGLIAWRVPVGREKYTAGPRCPDKLACRARVELLGDQWEVEETTRATVELIRE